MAKAWIHLRMDSLIRIGMEILIWIHTDSLIRIRVDSLIRIGMESLIWFHTDSLIRIRMDSVIWIRSWAKTCRQWISLSCTPLLLLSCCICFPPDLSTLILSQHFTLSPTGSLLQTSFMCWVSYTSHPLIGLHSVCYRYTH